MPPFFIAAFLWAQAHSEPVPAATVDLVAASGRCVGRSSTVLTIAPGQPPLLSFRLYQGRLHHRDAGLDLMLDDAGH